LVQDSYIANLRQEMVKCGGNFQMWNDHSKRGLAGK